MNVTSITRRQKSLPSLSRRPRTHRKPTQVPTHLRGYYPKTAANLLTQLQHTVRCLDTDDEGELLTLEIILTHPNPKQSFHKAFRDFVETDMGINIDEALKAERKAGRKLYDSISGACGDYDECTDYND